MQISVEIYDKIEYNEGNKHKPAAMSRQKRGNAMENYNPLLVGNDSPAKFITIGEAVSYTHRGRPRPMRPCPRAAAAR